MTQLSGWSKSPTTSEINEVFLLEHLVRCIEHMTHHRKERDGLIVESHFSQPLMNKPELWQWQSGFYRAAYRSFLAGAVLYRTYNEPLRMIKEKRPKGVLTSFTAWYQRKLDSTRSSDDWANNMTFEDMNHFSKISAYNYNVTEEKLQADLGPLAEWLIEDTKARVRAAAGDCPEYPFEFAKNFDLTKELDEGQLATLWEILQFVTACQHVQSKFANVGNRFGFRRFRLFPLPTPSSGTKEVCVIIFGVFRLEVVSMPVLYEESVEELHLLPANKLTPSTDPLDDIDIPCLINSLFRAASLDFGIEATQDYMYETAIPSLRLPTYMLRKHLGLDFLTRSTNDNEPDWDDESFCKIVISPTTFSGRKYVPPQTDYNHPGWVPRPVIIEPDIMPLGKLARYHPSTSSNKLAVLRCAQHQRQCSREQNTMYLQCLRWPFFVLMLLFSEICFWRSGSQYSAGSYPRRHKQQPFSWKSMPDISLLL